MYIKLVDAKCCYCLDLKTACFMIAYFLLFTQITGMVLALFICTNSDHLLEMLAVKDETELWANVLTLVIAVGVVLVMVLTVISFTILLIIGLHKDDRRLIRIYLVFSTFMLMISAIFCFVSEFVFVVNPTTAHYRVLSVAINACFLYVIRNYWLKLDSNNLKLYQQNA